MRRITIYALLGVVWTYATTAVVVLMFPVPYGYLVRVQMHRAELEASRPFLCLRVWQNPWGSYFQIHRTSDNYLNARTLTEYYDVETLTEDQKQDLIENPKLKDASFIPRWSRLRRDWPDRLAETRELFDTAGVWYELRMGWPLHCLRGGFTTHDYITSLTVRNNHGIIPVWRPSEYLSSYGGTSLVGLPLIPDWPAFLGSVLLYGALSFAGVTAWRSARGWRRRRRGRCVGCGYNLTGNVSGTCPECGVGTG